MNVKHKAKIAARRAREARQARRVINGIFIGLIALMVLVLIGYYVIAG
jgi:cytochrome c-type biogenesis protein CcmH/NrfG